MLKLVTKSNDTIISVPFADGIYESLLFFFLLLFKQNNKTKQNQNQTYVCVPHTVQHRVMSCNAVPCREHINMIIYSTKKLFSFLVGMRSKKNIVPTI